MATVMGTLVFIIIGCIAVYGYMSEVKAADRFSKPPSVVPPTAASQEN